MTRVEKACLLPLAVLVGVAAWMGALGCTVPRPLEYRQPDFPVLVASEQQLAQLKPGTFQGTVRQSLRPKEVRSTYHRGTVGYREPGMVLVAKTCIGDAWIEAHEIEVDRPKESAKRVWLYFCADRFIQVGPPFDWPTEDEVERSHRRASDSDW